MTDTLAIPAASVPVVRVALRMELLSVLEDLHTCLTTGEPDLSDELSRFDEVRQMLAEVDGGKVRLDGRRAETLARALRRELDTARDMADTDSAQQRERAEATVAIIEGLLSR